jgi:class 3 adenylate cyclase/tetratricopeptide (TPR) repeat protein
LANPERSREVERRRATILFTDLTGYTSRTGRADPEETSSVVWPCIAFLDEIARKHGGAVERYEGDAILATFGVPFAVEDAARAAINAAIEMHNRLPEFCRERRVEPPLQIHTGISSGLVVSRDVSTLPVRVEFSVVGDAVNVAARLKDLAPPGRIWVGPETHRHARDVFRFQALEPLRLKGKPEPMPVYEVVSRQTALHRPGAAGRAGLFSRLVGRSSEVAALEARVAELASGSGGVVRIVGPAGIGKSRLVAEVASFGVAVDSLWLHARSIAIGANLSFHPFADLLRAWAGTGDEKPEPEAFARFEARVRELCGEEAPQVVPFLAPLAGLPLPLEERRALEGIEGEALEKLRLGAMGRWLRRLAARQALVAVFEDVHWADASSLELLDPLLRLAGEHRILFLLVQRPDAPAKLEELIAAAAGRLADRYLEIPLAPLDRGSAEALLDDLFRGGDLPHATRSLIEERAGGNPFFLEEIVRALLDDGAIELRDGALFATEKLAGSVIPGTVQEVVLSRLDRLPRARRQLLQLAAVVGRACYERVLAHLSGTPTLAEELAPLVEAELLVRRERMGEVLYEFKHPLLQEVTYEAIGLERRRELHARVARGIEQELPESLPGRSGMLAYHFGKGREPERAEHYLMQAGEEASRASASSEALHFLQEASRLYREIHGEGGDPLRKAAVERQIALAFFNRGRMPEGDEHFDRALALMGERVPGVRWRRGLRYGSTLARVLLDLYLSKDPTRRRPPTEQDREILEMMFLRAQAQVTADPQRFFFDSMENLRRLNQVDPRTVENAGGMYASSVGYFSYAGLSLGLEQRLLRLAASLVNADDPREQFLYRLMSFIFHLFTGDWDERHSVEASLVEENLRLGQLWYVINYLPLEAKRRTRQGRFPAAAELIEQIAKIRDLYAYDLAASNQAAGTMYLHLERRRLPEALKAATEYYGSFREDLLNLLALGTRARIERLLGRRGDAEESFTRADAIVKRLRFLPPFHLSEYLLAGLQLELDRLETAMAEGDRRAARRAGRRVRRRARRTLARATKVAWQRPESFCLAGTGEWLCRRKGAALRLWERSLACAESVGMRPEAGRTWLEVGRRLAGGSGETFRGVSGSACFDRAEAIFGDLGLDWDLERLAAAREEARARSPLPA